MKNSITIYSFCLFFIGLISLTSVQAQESKLKNATEKYENLNYVNAQKIYLEVAEKGYASEEVFTKLANSYYFNAQYNQAVKWYDSLFNLNANPDNPLVYLRFSQALKATGKLAKASEYYDAFAQKSGNEANMMSAQDYEALIQENSGRYDIAAIEKIYDDNSISFGYFKLENTLYYASTNDSKSLLNTRSAWDGLSFLSLYAVELDSLNQAIAKPDALKGNLNSKFHESSPVFTSDQNTMYFTRSNTTTKNRKQDQKLKIYRSERIKDTWQEAEELSINSDYFSTAHPALSPDGTLLFFASDRPGGFGESDIYRSVINADGSLEAAVNLGSEINTSGKETFPFVSNENELYFSSDGHFGLGGLDVFYVKIKDDGYGNLLNIGAPVNSNADDFAFGIDKRTGRGFISSNRSTQEGEFVYDNIYTFLETSPIIDVYFAQLAGLVTDKQTGLPIEGALVVLTDADQKVYKQTQTDEDGNYIIETNKFQQYYVNVSSEKYDTDEVLSKPNLELQQIDFELQSNEVALVPGTDLAKVLNIPIIYFDFDKSDIRQDAAVELEKVLAVLNQYPNLKLEIRSHTDSRGNDVYNMALSQRRATSTLDYLVENGITEARLKANGMGETNLINTCSNGVSCSEADHQKNRRSEFIVIE
ncbi:outer membrane protein OmpA-like peptidoglycan-associated protein [Gelidibacter algens]|uniref:Outer membrane protein OmpA-like peptidoglycan-associated protein n=1 Tax=Gelidibacter algens TaxID=49280 RepID=A0A1A7R0P5_9FLAO|nr:OmpA family protein [Gelidibacter algens]OBX25391.1 cell envelope biogenesis protein OmpA [Gelidibacter algens]RAJ24714.1 outer membrane protein OmpA-like peptidoglycan-associated protein [Gelidibacter algens]